jgi:hypothetical protein
MVLLCPQREQAERCQHQENYYSKTTHIKNLLFRGLEKKGRPFWEKGAALLGKRSGPFGKKERPFLGNGAFRFGKRGVPFWETGRSD